MTVILTQSEEQIRAMYCDDFLTVKQIALRRKTSIQAVYKIIKKIKQKGMLVKGFKDSTHILNPTQKIRLHGIHLIIKIIYKDERYLKLINQSNIINLDGNTIRLWKNEVEIYSKVSFFGNDENQATSEAFTYWNRQIRRLESDLKIILIKDRHQNIKLVAAHYAEINNEVAKDYEKKGDSLKVYAEDGKLCFIIDNSFNYHEFESVHPLTAKQDSEKVRSHFIDIRNNPSYLPSQQKKMLDHVVSVLDKYADQMDLHLKVEEETLKTMKAIQRSLKEKQTRLDRW